jgi:hypothetical protein
MLRAHSNYNGFSAANPYFEARVGQESFLSADPFQPYESSQLSDAGRAGYEFHFGRHLRRDISQRSHRIASNSTDAVQSAFNSLPEGTLEFGAIGDEVSTLQAALLSLGYFGSGSLDVCDEKGVFEDRTFASLAT